MRVYAPEECGSDGYPVAWHETIKHLVREQAGHRCERCHHPYRTGANPMERFDVEDGIVHVSWSPCDSECRHGGPVRWSNGYAWREYNGPDETIAQYVEARARILTVHHLTGDKADCRWWNLAALCQRCHLSIQGKVVMGQLFPFEHSEWFKPHAAGFYAWTYLREELSREQVEARMDELLALELVA